MAYYTSTDIPYGGSARSDTLDANFTAIQSGFAMLPTDAQLKTAATNYAVDTGIADAYVISLPYAPASYTDGLEIVLKTVNANTGAATVNVNSLGIKSLKRQNGIALIAGDLEANKIYSFRYNATSGFFEIESLATGVLSQVATVSGIAGSISTVAGISANVTTVAGISANVTTVAGVSTAVASVGPIAANVTTVAGVAANVTTVAGISTNVTTVAGVSTAVASVGPIAANVTTVAGISAAVSTVSTNSASVVSVAAINADVTTAAANIAAIVAAPTNAATAATKAAEAAASAASALNAPGTSATSTTSLTVATGSKTLTIQTGKAYSVGQGVVIANTATPANYMTGQITAHDSGTGSLTVNVTSTGGSGTFTAWTIGMSALGGGSSSASSYINYLLFGAF